MSHHSSYPLRDRTTSILLRKGPLTRAAKRLLPSSGFYLFKAEMLEKWEDTSKTAKSSEILATIANAWKELTPRAKSEWEDKLRFIKGGPAPSTEPQVKPKVSRLKASPERKVKRVRFAADKEQSKPIKPAAPKKEVKVEDNIPNECKTPELTLNLHYRKQVEQITFLRVTSMDAIDKLIKKLFQIDSKLTLCYTDEKGKPIESGLNSLPNNSKVTVHVEEYAKKLRAGINLINRILNWYQS